MSKRVQLAFSAIVATALAFNIVTAQADGVIKDLKGVKAGTYKVDPYHTQVVFSLSHLGFTNFTGALADATGSLEFDPKNIAASKLTVSVPTASVLTHVVKLNDELKSADWMDAAQYPEATFTTTKITPNGSNAATIIGDLTLHGVTKPVTLKARFVGAGVNPINKAYTVGFEATATIKRSEFGVSKYVPVVGDEVHLTIAGAFEAE